jgi:hypothetical protein
MRSCRRPHIANCSACPAASRRTRPEPGPSAAIWLWHDALPGPWRPALHREPGSQLVDRLVNEDDLLRVIGVSCSPGRSDPVPAENPVCIRRLADLDDWHVTPHARRLITTCWQLGHHDEDQALQLARWAHQLGYRGWFSTRSRRYSITLTSRRDNRRQARTAWIRDHLGLPPSPTSRANPQLLSRTRVRAPGSK